MVVFSFAISLGGFFYMIIYQNNELIALFFIDAFKFKIPILQPFNANFKSMILYVEPLLNKAFKFYKIDES